MKLAVMQPYLFPYIGYFKLIKSVDTFVVFDDVNYKKKGWVNRNNILLGGYAKTVTLELIGSSQNKYINEIYVGENKSKLLKTINHAYHKAPYFPQVYPLIEKVLMNNEKNLARFVANGLCEVSQYLGMAVKWIYSSEINKDNNLTGQDKILEVCKVLKSSHYFNLPGGKSLYDADSFSSQGIRLEFINSSPIVYKQFENDFVANLSIIDVMMFNNKNVIENMLAN